MCRLRKLSDPLEIAAPFLFFLGLRPVARFPDCSGNPEPIPRPVSHRVHTGPIMVRPTHNCALISGSLFDAIMARRARGRPIEQRDVLLCAPLDSAVLALRSQSGPRPIRIREFEPPRRPVAIRRADTAAAARARRDWPAIHTPPKRLVGPN